MFVWVIYGEDAFGRRLSGIRVELLVMNGQPIGHLHDDVFLLLRPEFISFFLSYLTLVIQAVTSVVVAKKNYKNVRPKKWSRSLTGGGRLREIPTV